MLCEYTWNDKIKHLIHFESTLAKDKDHVSPDQFNDFGSNTIWSKDIWLTLMSIHHSVYSKVDKFTSLLLHYVYWLMFYGQMVFDQKTQNH
jgi:hypothetical protein